MLARSVVMILAGVLAAPQGARAQGSPVLTKILAEAQSAYSKHQRPMVIFDVDGTLLDNRPRILRILKEFSGEKAYVTADAAQRIANLNVGMIQYRLPDTLNNAGIIDANVRNNAAAFWGERFFNEAYLKYDKPTNGSVNFVRTLYSHGARIVYLTGRDAPRQLIGTVRALRDYGFPIGIQGTELIMKPTLQEQDAIFKQHVTNYLRQFGTVVATFDNEPANANVYRRAFPKAEVVLYMAPHSPNPPPLLPNIASLSSF